MSTSKTTTIRVSVETYEELSKQGTVVDSFDSVIKQLLKMKKSGNGVGVISK
jgi:predicted CopG family antitoxin